MFAKETRVDGLRVQGPPFLDANFLKISIIFTMFDHDYQTWSSKCDDDASSTEIVVN